MLIALAIGTALYAAVLAIGRDALPGSETRFESVTAADLPTPEHLDLSPEFEHTTRTKVTGHAPSERYAIPIQLEQIPDQLRAADAGVATFQTDTGADFRWYPLRDALAGHNGSLLITADGAANSKLTITLAAQRSHARHGYLIRREIAIQAPDGDSTPIVVLSQSITDVQLELPTDADRAGPLVLRRLDDAQWLPMLQGTSGLTLTKGRPMTLQLGAGSYELQDPLSPTKSQRFEVPATDRVVITRDLAPPRVDRP